LRHRRLGRDVAEILLVEDNPGDVFLAREAFRLGQLKPNISVAEDGMQALQMLKKIAP